ncbi:hypothetical protein RND71_016123 [Anisodus tanguticus]|uniref:Uncharacterized protein n=1 Tax=Anisodus tanguticus TaxID=243964 RepID=A0AAE1VLW7_9SOLA|nr:hypothetical protein RND71_016123 [Anisodus tanguticus]
MAAHAKWETLNFSVPHMVCPTIEEPWKVVIGSRSKSNAACDEWRLKILGNCGSGPSVKGMFTGSSCLEE